MSTLYHLAETARLFKCDFLKGVPAKLDAFFASPEAKAISDSNEIYYASLVVAKAKQLGVKETKKNFLATSVKSGLLKSFNRTDWSLAGKENGITLDSLRAAATLASLNKNEEVGTDAKDVLKSGIQKIVS